MTKDEEAKFHPELWKGVQLNPYILKLVKAKRKKKKSKVDFTKHFSELALTSKASEIREILKILSEPNVISFAGGIPHPKTFPLDIIKASAKRILENYGSTAVQYQATPGIKELRREIATYTRKIDGIPDIFMDNVIITTGAQEALYLIARMLISPKKASIIVEDPTYVGAIGAFKAAKAKFQRVGMEEDGIVISDVEKVLKRKKVQFIYVVPTFQNPSGVTMCWEKRKALYDLACKYDTLIVEDNPYGRLRYRGKHVPSIKSIDEEERVMHLGTYSKVFAPGTRIGYFLAHEELVGKAETLKQNIDLHSGSFDQYLIYEYLSMGHMSEQIRKNIKLYGGKMHVMLKAMDEYMPKEVHWTKPDGGMFLWATIPENYGINTRDVLADKLLNKEYLKANGFDYRVAYVPGGAFFAGDNAENTMRINFTNADDDMIVEGVKILSHVLKEELEACK